MKANILSIGLALGLAGTAQGAMVNYFNGTGGIIPDGSRAGMTQTIDTTDVGIINNVSVLLRFNAGYNGDLYGYLAYNDGSSTKTQILLNRMGGGSSAASGAGFGSGAVTDFASLQANGVTLVDGGSGGNIHNATPGAGNPVVMGGYTGYTPDSGGVTFVSTFQNLDASGTWTLFLSDLAAGDRSSLVSWGLSIDVVPEPITWALIIFGGVFGAVKGGRYWWARRKV